MLRIMTCLLHKTSELDIVPILIILVPNFVKPIMLLVVTKFVTNIGVDYCLTYLDLLFGIIEFVTIINKLYYLI